VSKRIGVLMGGVSEEREISLKTGEAVLKALESLKHDVFALDMREHVTAKILASRLDAAFIALHGKYGEDGCIQGMMEIMRIPYTGSGVLASALAMHKWKSRVVMESEKIPVPKTLMLDRAGAKTWKSGRGGLRLPVVVKPVSEGSSVGISIVRTQKDFSTAARAALKFDPWILVEEFVDGHDVQVALIDGEPLGAIEVKPVEDFYDYKAKYLVDTTEYLYPAPLAKRMYQRCLKYASQAHHAIGCRGVTRVDMMVDAKGPKVLEVNTLPGLTEHSLVPKIAAAEGISFPELVGRIVDGAALGG